MKKRTHTVAPCARATYDPVYRVTYLVVVSRQQDFLETLKKLALSEMDAPVAEEIYQKTAHDLSGCNGRCWRLEAKQSRIVAHIAVIWIRSGVDVSVVAHEAWHALHWVFQYRGVQFDDGQGCDEPVAYYLQWLVRFILGIKA